MSDIRWCAGLQSSFFLPPPGSPLFWIIIADVVYTVGTVVVPPAIDYVKSEYRRITYEPEYEDEYELLH